MTHVLTLMTGSGLGQLIALLLAPIVTRFYSAEEFATLEQFAMLLAVLAVFSTGKYEFAIMLPKKEENARVLGVLSMRIAVIFSAVMLVVLLFTRHYIADAYKNPELADWILLLPLAIMGFAIFNTLNYWFSRREKYVVAATSKTLNSVVSEPSKIALGLPNLGGGGLVLGIVLGRIVSSIYMIGRFLKHEPRGFRGIDREERKEMARKYRDYPMYTTWGSALGRLAQWAHIFLFSYFFGLWAVGFFALTRRVVQNPLNIIAGSYGQVFYQRISKIERELQLRKFYMKNLLLFGSAAAAMVLAVQMLPTQTMGFVFGEKWAESIDFLKILVFWYALNFVSGSLSFINHKLQKQKQMFVLDALHFIMICAAIIVSYRAGNDALTTLEWFVIAKVIFFLINIAASVFFVFQTPIPSNDE